MVTFGCYKSDAAQLYTAPVYLHKVGTMPIPEVSITEVAELSETERGEGGYGSSDEKLSAPDAEADKTQDVENTTEDATMAAADSLQALI